MRHNRLLVAPLAGSVDRNYADKIHARHGYRSLPSRGAWIEILRTTLTGCGSRASLPSRGAWIEIHLQIAINDRESVAPLAGSVDRNSTCSRLTGRRAEVAPLAGSVDRNQLLIVSTVTPICRSPRGERG